MHDVDRAAQADEREEFGELSKAAIHPEGFVSYGQPIEQNRPSNRSPRRAAAPRRGLTVSH